MINWNDSGSENLILALRSKGLDAQCICAYVQNWSGHLLFERRRIRKSKIICHGKTGQPRKLEPSVSFVMLADLCSYVDGFIRCVFCCCCCCCCFLFCWFFFFLVFLLLFLFLLLFVPCCFFFRFLKTAVFRSCGNPLVHVSSLILEVNS